MLELSSVSLWIWFLIEKVNVHITYTLLVAITAYVHNNVYLNIFQFLFYLGNLLVQCTCYTQYIEVLLVIYNMNGDIS